MCSSWGSSSGGRSSGTVRVGRSSHLRRQLPSAGRRAPRRASAPSRAFVHSMALRLASCPGANSPRTSRSHAGIAAARSSVNSGCASLGRGRATAGTGVAGQRGRRAPRSRPRVGSPGANRFPSSASSPVSAASAASTRSGEVELVGPHALGPQHGRSPRVLRRALRAPGTPARTTALACGKTSSALPFGLPAAYVGEPGVRRLGEHLEPHLHPREEAVAVRRVPRWGC